MVVGLHVARARIDLKSDRVIVDIDNPETHQTQFHTANFNTSKFIIILHDANYREEITNDTRFEFRNYTRLPTVTIF